MKSQSRTLTLRLTPEQAAQLDRLQDLTGEKTASKTLHLVAARHEELLAENQRLDDLLYRAELEIERLQGVVRSAQLSAAALLDVAGQTDFFACNASSSRAQRDKGPNREVRGGGRQ